MMLNSTGDRLRRATQLWHALLSGSGQRFDLASFLKDPAVEKQVLEGALTSGDAKVVALAQDWMRDTGQPVPQVVASRVVAPPAASPASAATAADAPKKSRYLKGVR